MKKAKSNNPHVTRPEKGRAVFYTRDSGGEHQTTPPQYVSWAANYCRGESLRFNGTPEGIMQMIRDRQPVLGDLFLDWDVKGNLMSRPALDALSAEIAADVTISHLLIPRRDRLIRPDQIHQGQELEQRFTRELGVTLVFMDHVSKRLQLGEKPEFGEYLMSTVEYEQAERYRRELAEKMIYSQLTRAQQGHLTGGRVCYGFQRWLVDPAGQPVRALADGETVHREGHHVIPLPKDDGTFEIRLRILRQLETMRASQLAPLLTREGILSPDAGRTRHDRSGVHVVSGVWHATTITKIARDPINQALIPYGRRSMGDRLRFSPQGPRKLKQSDYRKDDDDNDKPKVVQNAAKDVVLGPGHFTPLLPDLEFQNLQKILDQRAGTQKGKPRSRSPEKNPLGSQAFDMSCGWPLYRTPYLDSFRYTCGLYQQSHGAQCQHNHIDGPTATRFVLSCLRQRLLSPKMLNGLEERLRHLATAEAQGDDVSVELQPKKAALAAVDANLMKAKRNMALAENENQFKALASIFEELQTQQAALVAQVTAIEGKVRPTLTPAAEVNAAMATARRLVDLASDPDNFAAIGEAFRLINARIFVRFQAQPQGRRILRKSAGGVVTFGLTPPPIAIYGGPTARVAVKGGLDNAKKV